jgi:hypothetical protein
VRLCYNRVRNGRLHWFLLSRALIPSLFAMPRVVVGALFVVVGNRLVVRGYIEGMRPKTFVSPRATGARAPCR